MGDSIAYYSLPPMQIVTPGYLLFYSLIHATCDGSSGKLSGDQ